MKAVVYHFLDCLFCDNGSNVCGVLGGGDSLLLVLEKHDVLQDSVDHAVGEAVFENIATPSVVYVSQYA